LEDIVILNKHKVGSFVESALEIGASYLHSAQPQNVVGLSLFDEAIPVSTIEKMLGDELGFIDPAITTLPSTLLTSLSPFSLFIRH
jgi:hypothetical protein